MIIDACVIFLHEKSKWLIHLLLQQLRSLGNFVQFPIPAEDSRRYFLSSWEPSTSASIHAGIPQIPQKGFPSSPFLHRSPQCEMGWN